MKLVITKSLMVRLTFFMMCLVAIVYGVYILDMPHSMYLSLQVIRILLFVCVFVSLVFNRFFIDKNTLSVMAFASFALIRSAFGDGDILHQILTIMTWPLIYTLFYSYTMDVLKKTDEYARETKKFKEILGNRWRKRCRLLCASPCGGGTGQLRGPAPSSGRAKKGPPGRMPGGSSPNRQTAQ